MSEESRGPGLALTRVEPGAADAATLVRSCSSVLSAAFIDDPSVVHADPVRAHRQRWLPVLYTCTSRYSLATGGMHRVGAHGVVQWLENEIEAPFWLSVWFGFWRLLFTAGFRATWRMMQHEAWCARRLRALGRLRYGYIWILGVDPMAQRSGYGRTAVEGAAAEMRALGHEVCLLKTENPANVAYYEHLGFRCVDTQIVPPSQLRYWLFEKSLSVPGK